MVEAMFTLRGRFDDDISWEQIGYSVRGADRFTEANPAS
jgi:hypothetical protein